MSKKTANDSVADPTPASPAVETDEQLVKRLFGYVAPTEVTGPKHKRVNAAAEEAHKKVGETSFTVITEVISKFALTVLEECPPSADRSAAMRCIALARNAMNDIACGNRRVDYHSIAHAEITKARYQANTSIALGGK